MSSSTPEQAGLSFQGEFQASDVEQVKQLAAQFDIEVGDVVMPKSREGNLVTRYGGIRVDFALITLVPQVPGAMENFWRNYEPGGSDRDEPGVDRQGIRREIFETLDGRTAARRAIPDDRPNVEIVDRAETVSFIEFTPNTELCLAEADILKSTRIKSPPSYLA